MTKKNTITHLADLDNMEAKFECPNPQCTKEIKERAGRLQQQRGVICPHCNSFWPLNDTDIIRYTIKGRDALEEGLRKLRGD